MFDSIDNALKGTVVLERTNFLEARLKNRVLHDDSLIDVCMLFVGMYIYFEAFVVLGTSF